MIKNGFLLKAPLGQILVLGKKIFENPSGKKTLKVDIFPFFLLFLFLFSFHNKSSNYKVLSIYYTLQIYDTFLCLMMTLCEIYCYF